MFKKIYLPLKVIKFASIFLSNSIHHLTKQLKILKIIYYLIILLRNNCNNNDDVNVIFFFFKGDGYMEKNVCLEIIQVLIFMNIIRWKSPLIILKVVSFIFSTNKTMMYS